MRRKSSTNRMGVKSDKEAKDIEVKKDDMAAKEEKSEENRAAKRERKKATKGDIVRYLGMGS